MLRFRVPVKTVKRVTEPFAVEVCRTIQWTCRENPQKVHALHLTRSTLIEVFRSMFRKCWFISSLSAKNFTRPWFCKKLQQTSHILPHKEVRTLVFLVVLYVRPFCLHMHSTEMIPRSSLSRKSGAILETLYGRGSRLLPLPIVARALINLLLSAGASAEERGSYQFPRVGGLATGANDIYGGARLSSCKVTFVLF